MASTDSSDDSISINSINDSIDSADLTPISQAPVQFEEIFQNIYVSRRKRQIKEDDVYECNCNPSKNELCDFGCLNRMYSAECNPDYCLNRELCHNRRFQNREWCKVDIKAAGKKGWGLFAQQNIKKDTFVIEYIGEVIDSIEVKARLRWKYFGAKKFFILSLGAGYLIDATMKGSKARFMNHSCSPNCYTQKWTVLNERCIGFFALKDIEIGDELTFDYQFQRYGEGKHPCYCGSNVCRKWLGASASKATHANTVHHHHSHQHTNHHRIVYRNMDANVDISRYSVYCNKLMNMKLCADIKANEIFKQLILKGSICKAMRNNNYDTNDNHKKRCCGSTMLEFEHICYRMLNVKKEINMDQLKPVAQNINKAICVSDNALLQKLYGDCSYEEEEEVNEDIKEPVTDEEIDRSVINEVLLASPVSLSTPAISPCSEASSNSSKHTKFSENSDSHEKRHKKMDRKRHKKSRKRRRSETHHRNEHKRNPFKRQKRDNAFASDEENDAADIKRNGCDAYNGFNNYNHLNMNRNRTRNRFMNYNRNRNYNHNNHNYNRRQMNNGIQIYNNNNVHNNMHNNNGYNHYNNYNNYNRKPHYAQNRFNNNNMNNGYNSNGRPRYRSRNANNYRKNRNNEMMYAQTAFHFANNEGMNWNHNQWEYNQQQQHQQHVFHNNRMQRNQYHNNHEAQRGRSRILDNKMNANRRFFDRNMRANRFQFDQNPERKNRFQINQNPERKQSRTRQRERERVRGRARKR